MLDLKKVAAVDVPAVSDGRVLMWFGTDGVLYRKDANGVAEAVGVGPAGANGRDSGDVLRVVGASTLTTGNQEAVVLQIVVPPNVMQVGDVMTFQAVGRFTSTAVNSTGYASIRKGSNPQTNQNAVLCSNSYGNAAVSRAAVFMEVRGLVVVRDGGNGLLAVTGSMGESRHLDSNYLLTQVYTLTFDPATEQRFSLNYQTGNNNASVEWIASMIELKR